MRQETRAVKKILKYYFPDNRFRLKFRESYSYIDISDKLVVSCMDDADIDDVITRLRDHTKGIRVYKKGEEVNASEAKNVCLFVPGTNEIVDGEHLELIEVCSKNDAEKV